MRSKQPEERIPIAEVKSHLSDLLERVRTKSLIVTITKHGRPVARLVPLDLPASAHLADAKGWLEDDDAFFTDLRNIVARRSKQRPRRLDLGG